MNESTSVSKSWSCPRIALRAGAALALLAALAQPAPAQCLDWKPGFGAVGVGANANVRALATFDDGTGPALYVGGDFTTMGEVAARGIARWDGSGWSAVGTGTMGDEQNFTSVKAITVFDDGTGPALYIAGRFNQVGGVPARNIAKWDGSSWSALSTGLGSFLDFANCMAGFDDGSGPALYVSGNFIVAGGVHVDWVARWNGSTWAPAGQFAEPALGMTVATTPGGTDLYASFNYGSLARWNGSGWSYVTSGPSSALLATLLGFDDGSGPALYVGGTFSNISGVPMNNIARWDGASWSALGAGTDGAVQALGAFDDGSGPALYAGGSFTAAGGLPAANIAKWNGSSWSPLGAGVSGTPVNAVLALCSYAGPGPALYAGGSFTIAEATPVSRIARWDGASWSPPSLGGAGTNGAVNSLVAFDDGSGEALYAGGTFTAAGEISATRIAKWDGTSWSPLGSGIVGGGAGTAVNALAVFDDGGGPALYAGGYFMSAGGVPAANLARWNGSSWSALGAGLDSVVYALAVFDDGSGPALYAGGLFDNAGGAPASHVARWNGSGWSQPGSGTTGTVHALTVFDLGGGPRLYAGGEFHTAGGGPANFVASWDGTSWAALGGGTPVAIIALAGFDDGSGPALYASSLLWSGGMGLINPVNRWDGAGWSTVGSTLNGNVMDLQVFDDGSGPALYAAGGFGNLARGVARLHAGSWTQLAAGLDDPFPGARALAVFDDGASGGPDLYLGGSFGSVSGVASNNIAEWRGCAGPGMQFCAGDSYSAGCPCHNYGAIGHGCQNSAGTGGAVLASAGATNPDTVVLAALGELDGALSIFLQGDVEIAPVAFGDGMRCVGGNLKRLYVKNASGGVVWAPGPGEASITATSAALGDPIAPGTLRYYQTYYRDPVGFFCAPPFGDSWNVTNGVRISW
jgi:hypothetical protein